MEEITSRANPLIKHASRLCSSRKYRREQGQYVCDGDKLFLEAVSNKAAVTAVLLSRERQDLADTAAMTGARVALLPASLFASVSPAESPQGVLFSCKIPPTDLPERLNAGSGHIVLDGLQDPGNLGTILRAADALGIESILLTEGCADPFNPKAARSAMGALFRQRVYEAERKDIIQVLSASGIRPYLADNAAGALDIRQVALRGCAVVIGSEGQGVSGTMRALCPDAVKIPISAASESLNAAVAASLFIWEMRRGRN